MNWFFINFIVWVIMLFFLFQLGVSIKGNKKAIIYGIGSILFQAIYYYIKYNLVKQI